MIQFLRRLFTRRSLVDTLKPVSLDRRALWAPMVWRLK